MNITIGKCLYSVSGEGMLSIVKNNKIIWKGSAADLEITFYLPEKTFTRVPSLYFISPDMQTVHICINRKDTGEIRTLRDSLINYGAKENLMSIMKAGMVKHSSVIKEKEEKKFETKQHKIELKQLHAEEKRKKAIENMEIYHRRAGAKEKTEERYTCTVCGAFWYSNNLDMVKNIHNALTFSNYSVNQVKDISRCPKCGSKASTHKNVKFWVDKSGNCVEREE